MTNKCCPHPHIIFIECSSLYYSTTSFQISLPKCCTHFLFFQEFLLLLSHKRPYSYRPDGEKKSHALSIYSFTVCPSRPHSLLSTIFRGFRKLQKSPLSFVVPVCLALPLSFLMKNFGYYWTDFFFLILYWCFH